MDKRKKIGASGVTVTATMIVVTWLFVSGGAEIKVNLILGGNVIYCDSDVCSINGYINLSRGNSICGDFVLNSSLSHVAAPFCLSAGGRRNVTFEFSSRVNENVLATVELDDGSILVMPAYVSEYIQKGKVKEKPGCAEEIAKKFRTSYERDAFMEIITLFREDSAEVRSVSCPAKYAEHEEYWNVCYEGIYDYYLDCVSEQFQDPRVTDFMRNHVGSGGLDG